MEPRPSRGRPNRALFAYAFAPDRWSMHPWWTGRWLHDTEIGESWIEHEFPFPLEQVVFLTPLIVDVEYDGYLDLLWVNEPWPWTGLIWFCHFAGPRYEIQCNDSELEGYSKDRGCGRTPQCWRHVSETSHLLKGLALLWRSMLQFWLNMGVCLHICVCVLVFCQCVLSVISACLCFDVCATFESLHASVFWYLR